MKLAPDDVKYETTTKERKRSLVIKDVKPEDAGKYVCEVGPHRTTAVVEVTKPEDEKKIKGSAIFDAWFNLECIFEHPKATVLLIEFLLFVLSLLANIKYLLFFAWTSGSIKITS